MTTLAAVIQETVIRTPDTSRYMTAAYVAIAVILSAYAASLFSRRKRAKEE